MARGRPKKIREVDDLEEIDEALKDEVSPEVIESGVESHPDFDPDLPENKQRDLR